jgi:hypothetical protein
MYLTQFYAYLYEVNKKRYEESCPFACFSSQITERISMKFGVESLPLIL